MREIKFRAWYANQEMHYGIAPIDNKYYIFFETQKRNAHDLQINRAISIMQYTGLKDKNGKEIYEGDIVFQEFNDNRPLDYGGFVGVIKQYECAYWIDNGINHAEPLYSETNENEVIGNIYENPELLEGEA